MNTNEHDAPWWQQMLTRREANKTIAKIGIASLAVAAGVGVVGCGDGSEDADDGSTEVQQDAIELQKKEGWNAGSTDKKLTFTGKTSNDSQGTMDWSNFNTSAALLKAWGVKNSAWQPYTVPTLVQALDQPSLKGEIGPVFTPAMRTAYSRGLGMREILQKTKNPETTMIVVDIPGPEAVAYAAAIADVADPVITFDNWPHPLGVVKSHETLGAMLAVPGLRRHPGDVDRPATGTGRYPHPNADGDPRLLADRPAGESLARPRHGARACRALVGTGPRPGPVAFVLLLRLRTRLRQPLSRVRLDVEPLRPAEVP